MNGAHNASAQVAWKSKVDSEFQWYFIFFTDILIYSMTAQRF